MSLSTGEDQQATVSLLTGILMGLLERNGPAIRELMRYEGWAPVADDDGVVRSLCIHMASGDYRLRIVPETTA
jgi:hypothetical protein